MSTSIKHPSQLRRGPAFLRLVAGYFSLVIGAAFLVSGLQLLYVFEPTAEET